MKKITHADVLSLEAYAAQRADYRARVMAHKKTRQVALGPNATLYFEDRITMLYQLQEILRVEKIFESAAIDEELAAYNSLIPDGSNWKATLMIEFGEEAERRAALRAFIGIERGIWVKIGAHDAVHPIANEDLSRETDEKTSAVHFLRFELSAQMVAAAKTGAALTMGVAHPQYTHATAAQPPAIAQSLAADLALT